LIYHLINSALLGFYYIGYSDSGSVQIKFDANRIFPASVWNAKALKMHHTAKKQNKTLSIRATSPHFRTQNPYHLSTQSITMATE
jgi:hypothetical protein